MEHSTEILYNKTEVFCSAVHRFGSDALLLARFAEPKRLQRAADLCSGCGIVSLEWHDRGHRGPCAAIELQPEASALLSEALTAQNIDHINPCCTGTHMNDSCETAAIHAVFGDHAKDIAVVSTKSMTGHLLGGAGGIEAVFTALALRDQFAPPTIHYAQPDPECDLDYVPNTGRQQEMQYALSNSLGFGGHNACIALRRWEG